MFIGTVTGYAILENRKMDKKRKMDFYLYQGESGAIYMHLDISFFLTKEQVERLSCEIDFSTLVYGFDLEKYKKFYEEEE